MSESIYREVTDLIIARLDAGTVPWRKPWGPSVTGTDGPVSLSTGNPYRGINRWILGSSPYGSPFWGTFNAIRSLGSSVAKGEKSTPIVFFSMVPGTDRTTGEKKMIPVLKRFRVFNREQTIDGIPKLRTPEPIEKSEAESIADAEALATAYILRDDGPSFHEVPESRAFYRPAADAVTVPEREQFESVERFYSVVFHELGHSTGHESRLKRDMDGLRFGNHNYSREELVAEFTAAFLCGVSGIANDHTEAQSASYIDHWRAALKDDPRAVVWAAGRAEKAAGCILGETIAAEQEKAA